MYRTLRNRIVELTFGAFLVVRDQHDADDCADAVELGRLLPRPERGDEIAVHEQLAAEDAADTGSGRTPQRLDASGPLAAQRVVGPRVELEVGGELGVVDRPLGELPAENRGAVRPGGDLSFVGAEGARAGMEPGELTGRHVDDA